MNEKTISVIYNEGTPIDGTYDVAIWSRHEVAAFFDRCEKKYRNLGDTERKVKTAEQYIISRIQGWELVNKVPFSREKLVEAYDIFADDFNRIVSLADTQYEEDRRKSWGN